MKRLILFLRHLLRNRVYVSRTTIAVGLKRRGGFGFIPRSELTREERFLKSLDLAGKNVYDVGGFWGLVTLHFARAVGASGSVTTFEPNPKNVEVIADHLRLNHFQNVKVLPLGLGSERAVQPLVLSTSGAGAQGTLEQKRQGVLMASGKVKVVEVQVDTLDNAIRDHQLSPPDFVKIDVEGLELKVLRGMSETIANHRPKMLIELHGIQEHDVATHLFSRGYRLRQIEDDLEITADCLHRLHGHIFVY